MEKIDFKIGQFHFHNTENWSKGENSLLTIDKYDKNGEFIKRILLISRELIRLLKNPLGKCPCCGRYFVYPCREHRNTAYVDSESNYMYACKDCHEQDDEYYQELWNDYYSSRL